MTTPSLLQQITDALNTFTAPFTHPQYIDGTLYLTQHQWDAFTTQYADTYKNEDAWFGWMYSPTSNIGSIGGIPVTILKPGIPVTLPSGKTLIYSTILNKHILFTHDPETDTYFDRSLPLNIYPTTNITPSTAPHNYTAAGILT